MAFLCPVRIRRGKKKKSDVDKDVLRGPGMGRITGSASIETLVRVGIEKEIGFGPDSKMIVTHDFTPCVDDELEVKRGNIVNVLYRENDWVYVISENRQEGFIPHTYCTHFGSPHGDHTLNNVKKKLPRDSSKGQLDTSQDDMAVRSMANSSNPQSGHQDISVSDSESYGMSNKKGVITQATSHNQHQVIRGSQASLQSMGSSQPEIHPFFKDPAGRYIVLYTFIARDENDVSVERGEFVTVLNREDPDWYWIVRSDGQEGFVPSGFVYPADVIQASLSGHINQTTMQQANNFPPQNPPPHHSNPDEHRFSGAELVMLYDYKAQAPDDLTMRRGDWIYADLHNQTVDGWLWAYAPKLRKYGFIPKAYARPPAMTSL
ncbi:SH3 domain-containing protein Dlish [Cloeon dipterum]|uniref:SH3 domain-containing protein Dlish n=1 Tax=Cloeon dipterum TaxID=197152 RepID=UPI00322076EA